MGRMTYYSQANHAVEVSTSGGSSYNLTDFHEGDSIGWSPINVDKVKVTEGFDSSAISISSQQSAKIEVSLKPTSEYCGILNNLVNQNMTTPKLYRVTITSGVNEKVVLENAGIHTEGGLTAGTQMQPRKYVFTGTILKHPLNN